MGGERTVLKTFLHISDLHIDHEPPQQRGGPYDPKVEWYIRVLGIMDGLLGHSDAALVMTADFFYRKLKANATLITTGDLTRNGRVDQLRLASDFLGGRLTPPYGRAGLSRADWRVRTVPGNHDHWPGRNFPLGQPQIDIANEFPLPRIVDLPLDDKWNVQFLLLNSDCDVGHWSLTKFMARGRFISHLQKLENDLRNRPRTFRVLVLHHSWSYFNRAGWNEIDLTSRVALEKFMIKHNIDVVLTGHIHEPTVIIKEVQAKHRSGRKHVMEARCGTTSRLEGLPARWGRPYISLERQSLLVHQIVEHNGELYWGTRVYRRLPASRGQFTDIGFHQAIRVWPPQPVF
jgi:3',5'-cyclic AMP phosphodiesterase CpdA